MYCIGFRPRMSRHIPQTIRYRDGTTAATDPPQFAPPQEPALGIPPTGGPIDPHTGLAAPSGAPSLK